MGATSLERKISDPFTIQRTVHVTLWKSQDRELRLLYGRMSSPPLEIVGQRAAFTVHKHVRPLGIVGQNSGTVEVQVATEVNGVLPEEGKINRRSSQ